MNDKKKMTIPHVVRNFPAGKPTLTVNLMSDGTIEKKYDMRLPDAHSNFAIELKILKRLHNCRFVPKLLDYNKNTLSLKMTYCGPTLKVSTRQHDKAIHDRLYALDRLWGVYRPKNEGKKKLILSKIDNATVDNTNGFIYLIDFGSDGWKIRDNKKLK